MSQILLDGWETVSTTVIADEGGGKLEIGEAQRMRPRRPLDFYRRAARPRRRSRVGNRRPGQSPTPSSPFP
jgi:hypothetical protein